MQLYYFSRNVLLVAVWGNILDVEIAVKGTIENVIRISEEDSKIILWKNDIDYIEYNKENIVSLVIK